MCETLNICFCLFCLCFFNIRVETLFGHHASLKFLLLSADLKTEKKQNNKTKRRRNSLQIFSYKYL